MQPELMIDLSVDCIRANPFAQHPLLVLKEQAGPRYLVLGIGPLEAEVIAIRLQGIEPPRPLIHDLLSAILDRFGAHLRRVEISELASHAFHARLVLEHNGEEFAFDARPSDAIALALRAQVGIYAAEAVLDAAGQLAEAEAADTVAPVDVSNLDVFKQFIDTLDTDDVRPGEESPGFLGG
jgi:bifunctional DNase/RNase